MPEHQLLDPSLRALVDEMVAADPDRLGQIDSRRILFVAGAARREARASIRPLTFGGSPPSIVSPDGAWQKPRIEIRGVTMLYEVCLRPRFFLDCGPMDRAVTIAHELWHIEPSFDGTLARDRRHKLLPSNHFDKEVAEIVDAWKQSHPSSSALEAIHRSSEARISAWMTRPPSRLPAQTKNRVIYGPADLFEMLIELQA